MTVAVKHACELPGNHGVHGDVCRQAVVAGQRIGGVLAYLFQLVRRADTNQIVRVGRHAGARHQTYDQDQRQENAQQFIARYSLHVKTSSYFSPDGRGLRADVRNDYSEFPPDFQLIFKVGLPCPVAPRECL